MNKNEIQQKYLELHNALGSRKDAVNKVLFDQQHRQIWADCDVELKARKKELESMTSLFDEQRLELSELISIFPEPSPPPRNLASEIDEIKKTIDMSTATQKGIAERINDLEKRIEKLEKKG